MRALEPYSQVCQPRFEYEYEYRPCGAEYEYESHLVPALDPSVAGFPSIPSSRGHEYEYASRRVPAGDLSVTVFLRPHQPTSSFTSAFNDGMRGRSHQKKQGLSGEPRTGLASLAVYFAYGR